MKCFVITGCLITCPRTTKNACLCHIVLLQVNCLIDFQTSMFIIFFFHFSPKCISHAFIGKLRCFLFSFVSIVDFFPKQTGHKLLDSENTVVCRLSCILFLDQMKSLPLKNGPFYFCLYFYLIIYNLPFLFCLFFAVCAWNGVLMVL